MPEYAGIQQVEPVQWDKLVGGLAATITETGEKRQARKTELDVLYQNADTDVRETEQFQNQNLNEFVLNAADGVRNNMYEWNQALKRGEIKPKEYRSRINNSQADWSMLANQAKTFDSTMENFLTRQQPGEDGFIPGSGFEQYMSGIFAGNADLQNTTLQPDPISGKIFLTKYNDAGKRISTVDVSRMSNPGNMIDNRFNLAQSVKADTDLWDDYKISTGSGWQGFTSIEDVRQNPAYQYAVDAKVTSVLSNNRSTASVLVDNGIGDYDFYENEQGLTQAVMNHVESAKRVAKASGTELSEAELVEIAKAKEDKMIKVEYDRTGVMQPLISDSQFEAARERVISEIEIQLGHDESKTAGWKPTATGGGSGGDDDAGSYASYSAFRNAWTEGSESAMNAMNPRYKFTQVSPGKWSISEVKMGTDDFGESQLISTPIASNITNPRDMAPYIFKSTAAGDTVHERYDREKENFIAAKGKGGESKTSSQQGAISAFGQDKFDNLSEENKSKFLKKYK